MTKPICNKCRKELKEFGALVFSPPAKSTGMVFKIHLCIDCWCLLSDWIYLTEEAK